MVGAVVGDPVRLTPRLGHGNSCTVIAVTNRRTKHILATSVEQCGKGSNATPRWVCEAIISEMAAEIYGMVGPVFVKTAMPDGRGAIATGVRGSILPRTET